MAGKQSQQYQNQNGITVIKENNIIMNGQNMNNPKQTNIMVRRLAEQNQATAAMDGFVAQE
jgi:hypothetical protein